MALLQQSIVDAIKTKFQTILTTASYRTNIGAHVHVWPTTSLDSTDLPGIVIKDTTSDVVTRLQGGSSRIVERDLHIDATVLAQPGTVSDTVMREMIADVYQAVGVDDTFGVAGVQRTEMDGHEPEVSQEENILIGARISFRVMYRSSEFEI